MTIALFLSGLVFVYAGSQGFSKKPSRLFYGERNAPCVLVKDPGVSACGKGSVYKSMTAYNNHRLWQDVYRPESGFGGLYVKLTVTDEVLILSFKER